MGGGTSRKRWSGLSRDGGVPSGGATSRKTIERACSYIQKNLNTPLTVERIAAQAYTSPAHLNRLFQSTLDCSIMRYVTRCRIESAQSLLRDTDLDMRSVSGLLGYTHPNHFSRVFCRYVGIPPTEYRQQSMKSASGAPHKKLDKNV